MPLKMVDTGLLFWLDMVRNFMNTSFAEIQLVKSDYFPAAGDTPASSTQADFDNYAAFTIGGFSLPTLIAGRALSSTAPWVWVCTGSLIPNNIYAVRVIDVGFNRLLWAERLPNAPVAMDAAGKTLSYTSTLTAGSEF